MKSDIPQDLHQQLKEFDQEHLILGWELLEESKKKELTKQLSSINLSGINQLYQSKINRKELSGSAGLPDPEKAGPPTKLVRFEDQSPDQESHQEAFQKGIEAIESGKIGAVLVAGGQGTRLGFPHAKGMFPIGPLSGKSLFQIFVEQLSAISKKYSTTIPYFIMTSDANHEETIQFFTENDFFGYDPGHVFFFQQGRMPAVHAESGKMILEQPGVVALSPDGHGGLLNAIEDAGLISRMSELGIEYLYYHQVDNPTALMCDPGLIGYHILHESELTTKVVAKRGPEEKMGVVCDCEGETRIIEYSDMPEEVAHKTDSSGNLVHWAGNMAIHVFNVSFIRTLLKEQSGLPIHIAHKKVPYWDHETGQQVSPEEPNAFKFEKFIFDALPFASRTLVVEADREAEFNPVKNETGDDSPEKVKSAISQLSKKWLHSIGIESSEDAIIEISPLFALNPSELKNRLQGEPRIEQDRYFQ